MKKINQHCIFVYACCFLNTSSRYYPPPCPNFGLLSLNQVVVIMRQLLLTNGNRTHQNHSLPKLGTEKMPQCMKMPNLAWSYHPGSGLESMDSQFGSYLHLLMPIDSIDNTTYTVNKPISSRSTSRSDTRIRSTGCLSHDTGRNEATKTGTRKRTKQ